MARKKNTLFFESKNISLYLGDTVKILQSMSDNSVDCVISSPPYYGQRDYGVTEQIGLEKTPVEYINNLIKVFSEVKRILKPGGSLWINLGDTYWSGKGTSGGIDNKQKNRRFTRPQDRTGKRPLCQPKQLLLIPHRFAIAMQEIGWIVRNDNVWHKVNPTPDPAKDRSSSAHEYIFHFVKNRRYYYNFKAVAINAKSSNNKKPQPSVWSIPTATNFKKHIAVFPEALVRIPILSTLPSKGTLLDPFCGSGTALGYAISIGKGKKAIGIDISVDALREAKDILDKCVKIVK